MFSKKDVIPQSCIEYPRLLTDICARAIPCNLTWHQL